jgi:hypothetical protein
MYPPTFAAICSASLNVAFIGPPRAVATYPEAKVSPHAEPVNDSEGPSSFPEARMQARRGAVPRCR